jgi:hypothetical protein
MMKKLMITLVILALPGIAFAQKRYGSPAPVTGMAYQSSSGSELTGTLGLVQAAVNVGFQYTKKNSDYGLGGYFFLQTSKERSTNIIVNQVMSFGGQAKVALVDTSVVSAYLSPGFGIHMIKDVQDTTVTPTRKSDKTAFGPTLRTGVLFGLTPTVKAGLEHFQYWNWFDDVAQGSGSTLAAAFAFEF